MRWSLLYFFCFIGLIACNKSTDRKFRLVKIYANGFGFPTIFEYDEKGLLSNRYVDFTGVTDAGGGTSFIYEDGQLSEIMNSHVSIAGFWRTVETITYFEDGRLKSMTEEVVDGRPETLLRHEFRYKDSDPYFDSCIVFITRLGVENPYQLYTFSRDGEGSILTQSSFSPDQTNWVASHTDEYIYGSIVNPEYKLGSPVKFRNYYSKNLATKVTRYNFDGTVLSQKNYKIIKISPMLICVKGENGEDMYYDLK